MKKIITLMVMVALVISSAIAQNPFGNGSDGVLTVNLTETITINTERAAVSGYNPAGNNTIFVDNPNGIEVGDEVLIICMTDPETPIAENIVGQWETHYVSASGFNFIVLETPLVNSYNAASGKKHQVVKIPNYTLVEVNGTLTCPAWDGSSGGILFFRASQEVEVYATGIITSTGKGYLGGSQFGDGHGGGQGGESFTGSGGYGGHSYDPHGKTGAAGGGAYYANKNGGHAISGGGGGSTGGSIGLGSTNTGGAGGGGGGHTGSGGGAGYGTSGFGGNSYNNSNNGQNGGENYSGNGGSNYTGGGGGGGGTYGSAELSRLFQGCGGGCGGRHDGYTPGFGGAGGGLLYISASAVECAGIIVSAGGNGGNGTTYCGGGGGGAGGSLLIQAVDMNLSNSISTAGGTGGSSYYGNNGGNGGNGRIRLNYFNLVNTGTITPDPYISQFAANIFHHPLVNTSNITGPYTVSALIYDNEGDPITSASIYYRINGGAFSQIVMSENKNLQSFTGNIPGQVANSTIEYYLNATDGTDIYTLPLSAPDDLFSFQITGLPVSAFSVTDNNNGTVSLNWREPLEMTFFTHYSIYRSEQDGFIPNSFNRLDNNITDTTYLDITAQDFHTYYYVISANFNFGGTVVEAFSNQLSLLVSNTSQTTVLGYAFLEDRSNHANIKVKFLPLSPSAVADSIYTNALGYFESHNILPGIYTIILSKTGFQTTYIRENLLILQDTDLGESTIYDMGTTVSGNVSGNWEGFYSVSGNITIPQGDSLIIGAGTKIRFLGDYAMIVYGYLACNGAEGDTVLFTSAPANQNQQPNQWQRIRFYDAANDNSYLKYTKIEYANDGLYFGWSGALVENCLIQRHQRYGIYFENSYAAVIKNTTIRNLGDDGFHLQASYVSARNVNISDYTHEGAYLNNYSKLTISSSVIQTGQSGVYLENSSNIQADSCTFTGNTEMALFFHYCYSRGKVTNCTIISNYRGIYLYHVSSPQILNNVITQNSWVGIEYYYDCDALIKGNQIISNNYGIIFNSSSHYCETLITGNLIANNTEDGIHKNSHTGYVTNPTITYNTIAGNGRYGIYLDRPGTEVITNNIIVNNGAWGVCNITAVESFENNNVNANASGAIYNLANMPVATWNFVSINPNNNAVCDIYRNINEDPVFMGTGSEFYHLQAVSKCINGGTSTVSDPDGSISDIGAFPFDLGNPHRLYTTGTGDQYVSLAWEPVGNDSLIDYNVYYRLSGLKTAYTFFGNTADTAINVTGLTNNELYDFTITGNYTDYESPYAPEVSEKPGISSADYDPGSFSVLIPTGSPNAVENFTITNNGTRDLHVQFAEGNPNQAYAYFDGSGDFVSYGYKSHLQGMSAMTMECWIYRQNNGHFEFMGKYFRNYQLAINSGQRVHFYKGYGTISNYSYQEWDTWYTINANQWYHIAMTWQGSTLRLYVNGALAWSTNDANSNPIPLDFHQYPFEFGRRSGENSYYFQGRLAEARMWNYARSQEEINNNMFTSLTGNEEGLLGYWPLRDDFNDYSSYGISGTPYGNVNLQASGNLPFTLFSVPQTNYQVAPGQSEIIPITFINRTDVNSKYFTTRLFSDDPAKSDYEMEIFLQYGEIVPATPVYFIPVAATGKPYPIVIKDAKIDGQTIAVGDEIGVFDGELCVGAGIFNGTFNFIITAWESDPAKSQPGFTPGNNMSFRMYDTSADLETNEAEETYFIGDDTFGYGSFSALSLLASVFNIQSVPVTGGQFNLVSFNMFPRYANAWTVFGGLGNLQIVYNDDGQVLIPAYNINTIGDINFLDGFYLFSNQNETIEYEGTFIRAEDWDITVQPNKWNYIAMLSHNPVAVTDVFAGLESSISIVQSATGNAWIPSESINTLGNMQPGQGYKIALAVPNPVTFSYPASGKFSPAYVQNVSGPSVKGKEISHFDFTVTGLPYAVIVRLIPASIALYGLEPGDEIGLFDGQQCVGAAIYEGFDQLLITTWQKDLAQGLNGYTPGHTITAGIYRQYFGSETRHMLKKPSGAVPTFGEGNFAKAVLDVVPASEEPINFNIQPNPFKNNTLITLGLNQKEYIRLSVYDNTGRMVKTFVNGQLSPETYFFNWYGTDGIGNKLHPGVYFMITETSGRIITEKVIILQ